MHPEIMIGILSLLMTVGCSRGQEFPLESQLEEERFVEANNAFAIRLYKYLASQGGNVFFCPLCLTSSLTMVSEGALGKTANELNVTLGFKKTRLQREMVRGIYAELNQRVRMMDSFVQTANALLVQKDPWEPSTDDFRETFQGLYNTAVREVDFRGDPQGAIWDINELVRSQTKGQIKRIFERLDASNQMLLVNAAHFRTRFGGLFSSNPTLKERFYNHGVEDHDLNVFVMENKGSEHRVADSYDFRALELPCGEVNETEFKLWILLPHKTDALPDVEDGLSTVTFLQIKETLMNRRIDVSLPRIRFDYAKDISKELQRLGLHLSFSIDSADFGGISSKKGLALTQVFHKTVVEINEPWSKTATGNDTQNFSRSLGESSAGGGHVPAFNANHPFVFCVVDDISGIILYMGRVLEF